MELKEHIKYSFPFAIILFYIYGVNSLYFIVTSILIDIDHMIEYLIKAKDLNIKRMFKFYRRLFEVFSGRYYLGIAVFHTIEFIFIVVIIAFYSKAGIFLLVGLLYHHLLDGIFLQRRRCFFTRSYSIVHYLYISRINPSREFLQMRLKEKEIIQNLMTDHG